VDVFMKISTKGRYALRIITDLAMQSGNEYISLKDISERQEISMKYLEMIVGILSRAGYVLSLRGKSGGYKLAKEPREYTVGSILKLTEGSLAPVACLENEINTCNRAKHCVTLPMWQKLDKLINDYLESVTIEDLITMQDDLIGNDYVI
jgi:Rrf2 family protein